MIKVNYGNNVKRGSTIVSSDTKISEFLESVGIEYSHGTTTLNGSPLSAGDVYKKFADLGIEGECYLYSIKKVDNAFDNA